MGFVRFNRGSLKRDVLWAFVLLLVLTVALTVVACGSTGRSSAENNATTPTVATTQEKVTITDDGGRKVAIPKTIKRVWCTSPMGTNLMYMLAPDMLVGWNVTPSALEKEYIPERYRTVVGLGGWYGKNTTGNVEEIIKAAPDVIFSIGAIDSSWVSDANRVQNLLNIPVVMVNSTLATSGDTLRKVGKYTGREARAEELAAYCDKVIKMARDNTAKLKESDKVKVYYAEYSKGLATDPAGTQHTEVLDLIGATNVAHVSNPSAYGMEPVSMERVISWNPQVIIVASDPAQQDTTYEAITTDSNWKSITAVKNKRVYVVPHGPFDWFDRPPSISRILGVVWLGNLLYPDLYNYDIKTEVKQFYKLFYQVDLTDAQLQKLMTRAQ